MPRISAREWACAATCRASDGLAATPSYELTDRSGRGPGVITTAVALPLSAGASVADPHGVRVRVIE
jgi:hypothetical protein